MTRAKSWAPLACLALLLQGCAGSEPAVRSLDAVGLEFIPRMPDGSLPSRSEWFIPDMPVVRRGALRRSMVLVAPVAARARLSKSSNSCVLEFGAVPVFNLGDGLNLVVLLSDSTGSRVLLERPFDAGRNAADREWAEFRIPIEVRGESEAHIELRVTSGPYGEETGDWLAISNPRLIRLSGIR